MLRLSLHGITDGTGVGASNANSRAKCVWEMMTSAGVAELCCRRHLLRHMQSTFQGEVFLCSSEGAFE